MKKLIETGQAIFDNILFVFQIIENPRSKRVSLILKDNNIARISIPNKKLLAYAKDFLSKNAEWLKKRAEQRNNKISLKISPIDIKNEKTRAMRLAKDIVEHFNKYYNLQYKKISIRNQSSRWGSASMNGTLTFNIRIVFLPEELQNYIVVHELCHLKEMNHGSKFWSLVEITLKNYKALRKELRRYQIS